MEIKKLFEKLRAYDREEVQYKEIFRRLTKKFETNPYILRSYLKNLVDLLETKDYQLYIIDILDMISIHNPEIYEGSIKTLISGLKYEEIQLDILSILENILQGEPNILIDQIKTIKKAIDDPNNIKIKSDLIGIKKDLKQQFPDIIIDPVDSLIREIENQNLNIVNIYDNLLSNYRDVIKNNIQDSIDDPIILLLSFSEKMPEIFRNSIEYLLNGLENKDLQLYYIDILKNIAKEEPIYFDGMVSRLISYLDNKIFQFDVIDILKSLTAVPRLFQTAIKELILKLEIDIIK
ncbi:MAG: hypothetical protein GF329_05110, partial [Candidatus Lokiarchaeota archaeon]|nr:hypothetical protein [Candidatus Lokiarchaeota archaeon]